MDTTAWTRRSKLVMWSLIGAAVVAIACGTSTKDPGSGGVGSLPVDAGKTGGQGTRGTGDSQPTLPPGTITATGQLVVGTDVKPGTYRGIGCHYWARLKNADGDLDSILANGNADDDEQLTVTILKSDYAFDNSCTALMPISYLRTVPNSNTSNVFGILVVGKDIHPGTWRGTATDSCYWARLSGFTGTLGNVLANDNVDSGAKFSVTVKPTDKGLEIRSGCGTLTKVG